nr:DUF2730 domain-containing protein [Gammaproteobacteria bacterium]
KQIIDFLKTNIRLVAVVILSALIIFLFFYSFSKYHEEKDIELGKEVNSYENRLVGIEKSKESSLTSEEQLSQVKAELSEIYQENKSFKNGLRAQYILAKIDYKSGEMEAAKEKFFSIFDYNKKHHLAPLALLHAASITENDAKYNEAIDLLEQHILYYQTHFTYGEALLGLSRNYELIGEYTKASSTLKSIIENEDLLSYHDRANQQIAMLTIKGLLN